MHARVTDLKERFEAKVRPEDVIFHTPVTKADAILVLGNRMHGAAMVLAKQAASLYKNGMASHIIVSGGVINQEGKLEALHIRNSLRTLGIPAQAITLERASTNTRENIAFSRLKALRMQGFPKRPKIIIVGQRFASRRIMMTMARQWPEATAMIAPVCMMGLPPERWHEHPHAMHTVTRESMKLPEYVAKGDIAHFRHADHLRALQILKAKQAHPRPRRPSQKLS